MFGPAARVPTNYTDDPEAVLRQARKEKRKDVAIAEDLESPPAGRPPNYKWRPEALASGSPAALTDRIVYASSFSQSTAHPTSSDQTKLQFSPIELSPSAPEKKVIDLHFKKLLGSNSTPHPPGFLPQFTPLPKSTLAGASEPHHSNEPTNTMSNEEDLETIRNLCSQVTSLEVQSVQLEQSREETAELKRLVRELLAERSRGPSAQEPVTARDLGQHELTQTEGSNSFAHYANQTPTSPTPMARSQQSSRPINVPRPTAEHIREEQPSVTHATHQRVSWAEETAAHVGSSRPHPVESTPAGLRSSSAHTSPLATDYLPAPNQSAASAMQEQQVHRYLAPVQHSSIAVVPTSMTANRIKLSDLPKFTGKFGRPADLFHWRNLIEETFEIKNLRDDREKLKLLGSLLYDEEMSSWYQANKDELRRQSWEGAMEMMAMGTLPYAWLTDTENALRRLEIKPGETFDQYVKRGQSIHRLIKPFGQVTDRHLAQHITWGAPQLLKDWIERDKLLLAPSFSFPVFKDAVDGIYRLLINSRLISDPSAKSRSNSSVANSALSVSGGVRTAPPAPRQRSDEERADNAWRYHEYLRRTGICATCKEKCNDPNCTRRNPRFLSVPADFNPGPRPRRTIPTTSIAMPAGAPTQRPAGRPPVAAAASRVAAVEEVADMFTEDIAAYEEADQFQADQIEEQANEEVGSGYESFVRRDGA